MPQPLYTQGQAFVENVFANPLSSSLPDIESQAVMATYLIDRTRQTGPTEQLHVVMTPSGVTLPKLTREVVGSRQVSGWQKTKEWRVAPKAAIATWVGSWALFNLVPLAADVADEASQAVYQVKRDLDLLPKGATETRVTQVPTWSTPSVIRQYVEADNTPGSAAVNPRVVRLFANRVQAAAEQNANTRVKVTARSSDDYGADTSLGVREPLSQDMADERAQAWSRALRTALPAAAIRTEMRQDVLTPAELRQLNRLATQAGFTGQNAMIGAIKAAEAGQGSRALRSFVTANFKRGVELVATVQNPDVARTKEVKERVFVPAENDPPADPDREYNPLFIPLPWWKKRRWTALGERDVKRWTFVPGARVLKPEVFRQTLDQAWLRIRPEAVKQDRTLVDDAWAFTRKYEHLVRDDRIAEVLRADYTDGAGNSSSLRVIFVDKQPDEATVTAYSALLQSLAALRTPDGRTVADTVTGMFVFPSEASGKQRNPKNIGVGIDSQYDLHTQGVMYYPLKLVELHMPTQLSDESLQEYLESYRGAIFTLAHEAAGHGTDVSAEPLTVRRVYSPTIRNAHIVDGDPRGRRMAPLHGVLRPLIEPSAPADKRAPRQFDIAFPVVDRNGKLFQMQPRVTEHDSRLTHAHKATIVGREPTQYASESVTEHYAETAAATATGISIDFGEADIQVPAIVADGVAADFATGYHPDVRAQQLYAEAVGGTTGSLPLTFAKAPEVTIVRAQPQDDPLLRAHMIRARQTRTPRPQELIALLAQTSRRHQ